MTNPLIPRSRGGTGVDTVPTCLAGEALSFDGSVWSAVGTGTGGWTPSGDDIAAPNNGNVNVPQTANTAIASVGTLDLSVGNPRGIAVRGRMLYIGQASGRLSVVDATRPALMVELGYAATGLDIRAVALCGRYAFVVGNNALKVVDVADPHLLVVVATLTPSPAYTLSNVRIAGNYAFLANDTNDSTIYVVDISNPLAPFLATTFLPNGTTPLSAENLCVVGGYFYATYGGSYRFHVWDVSAPLTPVSKYYGSPATSVNRPVVSGRFLYGVKMGAAGGGIAIYNVANPTAPAFAGSVNGPTHSGIALAGKYLYTYSDSGITVYDVSNPASPVLLHTVAVGAADPTGMAVSGKRAYLLNNTTPHLSVVDLKGLDVAVMDAGALCVHRLDVVDDMTVRGVNVADMYDPARAGILATKIGIDAKTVAATTLYTVPTGRTAVITGVVVRCTAVTAITVEASASLGGNGASWDDFRGITALTGLIAANKVLALLLGTTVVPVYVAAATFTLNITTGATGTSQTLAVDVLGYLL